MVRKVTESVRDGVLQFVVLAISRSERHGTLAGKINVYNKNNQYSWGCVTAYYKHMWKQSDRCRLACGHVKFLGKIPSCLIYPSGLPASLALSSTTPASACIFVGPSSLCLCLFFSPSGTIGATVRCHQRGWRSEWLSGCKLFRRTEFAS